MAIYGSYNAFKNYNSNYTARPKFWTMPRPSYHVKNEVNIKYTNFNSGYNNGIPSYGYGMPNNNFMNWLLGANLLGNLLDNLGKLFGKKEPEKIDHGGAEKPEKIDQGGAEEPELNLFGQYQEIVIPEKKEDVEIETTKPVTIPKATKSGDITTYTGWKTFRACCTASDDGGSIEELNTPEFRQWFLKEYFGKQDGDKMALWKTGEQNFPPSFVYNGHKYTVNLTDLADPDKRIDQYKRTADNTEGTATGKKVKTSQVTQQQITKYKEVKATVTVNVGGQKKTYTSAGFGNVNSDETLEQLKNKAKADLKSKYPQLTDEQLATIEFVKQKSE